MMTREPPCKPSLQPPEQTPMLPFEEAAPASNGNEPTGSEMDPREVWEALSAAMRAQVRRDCLRAMREVLGNAPE